MSPVFTPAELLSLPPSDLRDLIQLSTGLDPIVQAAALGLDLAITDHREAFLRAFPEVTFYPHAWQELTGQDGVRSDLTPIETAPDGPATGDQTAPDDDSSPFSGPSELLAHMNETRGTNVPFLAGTFALYAAPDGSIVMVTETEQAGLRRDQLPAKIVRLALGMASGQGGMLGRMFRRG